MVQDTIKILYFIYIWGHLTVNYFVYIVNVLNTNWGVSDKYCGMSSMADNISCSDKCLQFFQTGDWCVMYYIGVQFPVKSSAS